MSMPRRAGPATANAARSAACRAISRRATRPRKPAARASAATPPRAIGLARAIVARQQDEARPRLDQRRGVGAEIGEGEAGDAARLAGLAFIAARRSRTSKWAARSSKRDSIALSGRGNVADAVILADESLDRVEAVEPHAGSWNSTSSPRSPLHQVDMAKTGDIAAPRYRGSLRRGRRVHRSPPCPASSTLAKDGRSSHPHRHQHVERVRLVVLAQQGRRGGVGEVDLDRVALDLAEDVEQIAGVEADLEPVGAIVGRAFPRSRGRSRARSPTA